MLNETDIVDVELSQLDDNPYNPRLQYDEGEIAQLAASLQHSGQITPIRVRRIEARYQIVYGHRRVRAARLLNRKTIKAEVGSFSDREMLELSLVENLHRKDLSDYEKGRALLEMHNSGMTYEEISPIVGYSKQYISNLVRMTELFDGDALPADPAAASRVLRISEHHARLLLQIDDVEVRNKMLRLVVSENLSVRDLARIIHKLRSWFGGSAQGAAPTKDRAPNAGVLHGQGAEGPCVNGDAGSSDIAEITRLLASEFSLPRKGDFEAFDSMHAFEGGFSIYSRFPPYRRYSGSDARDKEMHWFFHVAPHYRPVLRDVRVQAFGQMALATCYVDYYGEPRKEGIVTTARGTVVFVSTKSGWKIMHEHWSKLDRAEEAEIPGPPSTGQNARYGSV